MLVLRRRLVKKYKDLALGLWDSAIRNIKLVEDNGFDQIKISVKSSDVFCQ